MNMENITGAQLIGLPITHERIVLRGFQISFPVCAGEDIPLVLPGIYLPDGRFVILKPGGAIASYSSEHTLLKYNPGAVVEWLPDSINEVLNTVEGE